MQNSAKIGLRYDHREFIHISINFRRVVQSAVTNEFIRIAIWLFINLGCVFRDVLLMNVSEGKKYWLWG